jgi:hypothetical protein
MFDVGNFKQQIWVLFLSEFAVHLSSFVYIPFASVLQIFLLSNCEGRN